MSPGRSAGMQTKSVMKQILELSQTRLDKWIRVSQDEVTRGRSDVSVGRWGQAATVIKGEAELGPGCMQLGNWQQ